MKAFLLRAIRVLVATVVVLFVANYVRDLDIPEHSYQGDLWGDSVFPLEYDRERWNIAFDQHSHTLHSDGVPSVEQNIQWHIDIGDYFTQLTWPVIRAGELLILLAWISAGAGRRADPFPGVTVC